MGGLPARAMTEIKGKESGRRPWHKAKNPEQPAPRRTDLRLNATILRQSLEPSRDALSFRARTNSDALGPTETLRI
jgi:hypothetical protein